MKNRNELDSKPFGFGKREIRRWQGFLGTIANPAQEVETPRKAIWKKNKATLWYYPTTEKKYQTPLFLIYSLINQPFILDLGPGNSLIQSLADEGYEVYLLDFGTPGYEDKDMTLDDYIVKYIQKGVQKALIHSKAKDISIMGFCIGGTLAAIYSSISDEPIKNLILFHTPIDFHEGPIFDEWLTALIEDQVDFEPILDACGIVPAPFMEKGIRLLTYPIYYSPYLSLLNRANDEQYTSTWSRINSWSKSHIPFPGATLKQLIELVKENKLVQGGLVVNGKQVQMSNIQANVLAVGSIHDKLVPKEQITPILDLVSTQDQSFHLLNGGHAILAKNGKLPSYLNDWLSLRSKPL